MKIWILLVGAFWSFSCPGPEKRDVENPLEQTLTNPEEASEQWDDPDRDEWQQPNEVIELMQIQPGMVVVDLGTGTGYFLPHLSRAVGPEGLVLALDIEPAMVEYVEERSEREDLENVQPQLVFVDNTRLKEKSVDRILIVNTWHYIPNREDYSRHLMQALAPGGSIFIVDFTLESEFGPPIEERLRIEQIVAELQKGGLDASPIPSDLTYQFVVKGMRGID